MRSKLFLVLFTTLTMLVPAVGIAHAAPMASRYTGFGGPVDSLGCASSEIGGDVDLINGLFVDVDEATYQDCHWSSLEFTVQPTLPWSMHALSQSGGVTTYTVDNIAANIVGPGCHLTVLGGASASYDSSSGVLTVPNQSIAVTFVDPADDCLGLVNAGERLPILSASYAIVLS